MKFGSCAVLPLLVLPLLGGLAPPAPSPAGAFEPTTRQGVAQRAVHSAPDTLRATAAPGTPLILPLPSTVSGHSVERYTLLRGPALSGVAGRSFTWIPEGAEPGLHEALLRTHAPDAPSDTLVVQINLQP